LLVDTDRVLPGSISPQDLEAIARQPCEVRKAKRCIKYFESLPGLSVKTLERSHELAIGKKLCALVPEAQDHAAEI